MSGIPSWARVGAKVVCIVDEWIGPDNYLHTTIPPFAPIKGDRLTIAEISAEGFLYFAELPWRYETPLGTGDVSWPVDAFRPLVTRTQEQDMAIFAPLLGHTVREDA